MMIWEKTNNDDDDKFNDVFRVSWIIVLHIASVARLVYLFSKIWEMEKEIIWTFFVFHQTI